MVVPQADKWDMYQDDWNTDTVNRDVNNEDTDRGRKVPGNVK